jgi:Flp pilus assembly protein TadD
VDYRSLRRVRILKKVARFVLVLLTLGTAWGQRTGPADLLRRAIEEQANGNLTDAVRDYEEVLRVQPGLTQARSNLAAALATMGRFDEAIAAYQVSLEQSPKNSEIRKNLALVYYSTGDAADAIREFRAVHEAHPEDRRVVLLLTECLLRTGKPGDAAALLEPLAEARPGDLELAYLRGMALIRNGQPEKGVEYVERAAKQGHKPEALLLAGATELDLGRFREAREDLDKAAQLNPNLPGVLSWAALAKDRTGDEEGAKRLFLEALEKNPRDFDANLHLGAIQYREKDYQAARMHIAAAREIDPASPMAQYAWALVEAASGNVEHAVKDLEKIVSESPNWVEPRAKLSSLYFKLGREADGERERASVDKLNAEHKGKSSPFEN